MISLLFSALCVATVSAQTDEKDNAMLNNGINFLDIPYVAHTLEYDGRRRGRNESGIRGYQFL